jgi:hypothetical protein
MVAHASQPENRKGPVICEDCRILLTPANVELPEVNVVDEKILAYWCHECWSTNHNTEWEPPNCKKCTTQMKQEKDNPYSIFCPNILCDGPSFKLELTAVEFN